jgi:aldose 1-epimerase
VDVDDLLGGPTMSVEGELAIESDGIRAAVIPFGASLVRVEVPDGDGRWSNVVVSLPTLADYHDRSKNSHLGATVGRYANRVAGARFELDGVVHHLDANDGPNTLHGGSSGWSRREWIVQEHGPASVTFRMESPDGDGGFPGEVIAMVTYSVDGASLRVAADALADAPTLLSLTNHTYWNLAGADDPTSTIDGHHLDVLPAEYLVVDDAGIPSGERAPVADLLGDGTLSGRTIDHCLLAAWEPWDPGWEPTLATRIATLTDPASGRRMWMRSNQPGLQVYTGHKLRIGARRGVALEAQQLPDAPNRPDFPSAVVRPGDGLFGTVRWSVAYDFDVIAPS